MQLLLENKSGQVLDLLNNRSRIILKSAEGLYGVETEFGESESPYMDGSTVENVKALPRGIELVFKINGNVRESIDFFMSYVKSKQLVTLRKIENGRDLEIKGIATIPPYSRMMRSCELTLTIYCGQPYWETVSYIIETISMYIDLLYFPADGQYFTEYGRPFGTIDTDLTKSFENNGDVAVGMLIEIVALGDVVNPRISCMTGEQNGWFMQLGDDDNPLTIKADDKVEINTVRGNKYITINGQTTYNGEPILNYLKWQGKDWLQLETGVNTFEGSTQKGETNDAVWFGLIYKGRYER